MCPTVTTSWLTFVLSPLIFSSRSEQCQAIPYQCFPIFKALPKPCALDVCTEVDPHGKYKLGGCRGPCDIPRDQGGLLTNFITLIRP